MAKVHLTPAELEQVRVAVLRWMLGVELTAADVAHRAPRVRADTLRKFLSGRRPSPWVAVYLIERFGPCLGLTYSPPAILPRSAVAAATAAATVSASR